MLNILYRFNSRLNKRIVMNNEIEKAGKPYLFRYRSDNENTLDEIENSYVYFANRESLNDPLDSSPDLIKFIKEKSTLESYYEFIKVQNQSNEYKQYLERNYSPDKLGALISETIPKYINSRGIACFSTIPYINMPIWTNYANNHKGICLQFNLEYDETFFNGMCLVKYLKELNHIEFTPSIDEHKINDIFFRKDINWSYEKELRLLKDKIGKINFNRKSLRNIVCGYRSDDEYIEKIITICNKNYKDIGIYKMEKPEKQNNASLIRIN